jgi:uncharacterized damage-inducible protein DinB
LGEEITIVADLLPRLRHTLDYDAWANQQTLESLQRADTPPVEAIGIMAHIIAADWLWLDRMREQPQHCAVWPHWSVKECAEEERLLRESFDEMLTGLSEPSLERQVTYKNTKGEKWSNAIADILDHLLVHSAYHRGQIALLLRHSGGEPAYTDFIHAVRTGAIN